MVTQSIMLFVSPFYRNILIFLLGPLDFGCLAMLFLLTQMQKFLVKNKTTSFGSSG